MWRSHYHYFHGKQLPVVKISLQLAHHFNFPLPTWDNAALSIRKPVPSRKTTLKTSHKQHSMDLNTSTDDFLHHLKRRDSLIIHWKIEWKYLEYNDDDCEESIEYFLRTKYFRGSPLYVLYTLTWGKSYLWVQLLLELLINLQNRARTDIVEDCSIFEVSRYEQYSHRRCSVFKCFTITEEF